MAGAPPTLQRLKAPAAITIAGHGFALQVQALARLLARLGADPRAAPRRARDRDVAHAQARPTGAAQHHHHHERAARQHVREHRRALSKDPRAPGRYAEDPALARLAREPEAAA